MGVVKDEHKESVHMDEVRRLSELSSGFESKYNDLVDVYFYELDTNFSVYVWYLLVAGLICVALDTFFLMRGNAQNEPVVFWVGVVFVNYPATSLRSDHWASIAKLKARLLRFSQLHNLTSITQRLSF